MSGKLVTAHRWIGLLIAVQLLLSAAGGLYWSTRDHRELIGETRRRKGAAEPIDPSSTIGLDQAAKAAGADRIAQARLLRRGGRAAWEITATGATPVHVDATTGEVLGLLTGTEAMQAAKEDYAGDASVSEATLFETEAPIEIRKKPLPLWRVTIADEFGTRIWIDAKTGDVLGTRTDGESIWDFFWMLHIMDWRTRSQLHHPLLAAFAIGVLLTAGTGLTIWGTRLVAWIRRRRALAA